MSTGVEVLSEQHGSRGDNHKAARDRDAPNYYCCGREVMAQKCGQKHKLICGSGALAKRGFECMKRRESIKIIQQQTCRIVSDH